jgi:hypothetical protein
MKKILIGILIFAGILAIAGYFYGYDKIGKQYTALSSANAAYKNGDWKEMYAYELGKQAFIYGYPAVYYANLEHENLIQFQWESMNYSPIDCPQLPKINTVVPPIEIRLIRSLS